MQPGSVSVSQEQNELSLYCDPISNNVLEHKGLSNSSLDVTIVDKYNSLYLLTWKNNNLYPTIDENFIDILNFKQSLLIEKIFSSDLEKDIIKYDRSIETLIKKYSKCLNNNNKVFLIDFFKYHFNQNQIEIFKSEPIKESVLYFRKNFENFFVNNFNKKENNLLPINLIFKSMEKNVNFNYYKKLQLNYNNKNCK